MRTRLDIVLWLLHDAALLLGGGLLVWWRRRNLDKQKEPRRCARCGRYRGGILHECKVRSAQPKT